MLSSMKVRLHRGAHEIGGNCIEIESGGQRIILDMGWPITVEPGQDVPLPDIPGLSPGTGAGTGTDAALRGIVISHPHPDHYGLMRKVSSEVPVYIGEAAANILREAAFFSPFGIDLDPAGFLAHRRPLEIGPFTVTPFLNDHSAFDAYSMLVEAEGKRLFYTGDIRGHGRKSGIFEELLRKPPENIDVLLMEGTHVRADAGEADAAEANAAEANAAEANAAEAQRGPSERDVEDDCVATFRSTPGMVLAMFSPQNIDRLVSVFRACRRAGRELVIDLYTAQIVKAAGVDTIPQPDWEGVRVYLPRSQKARVIREKAFDRTDAVKPHRIYEEELVARKHELVVLFRASMARELDAMRCLDGAGVVWSMWDGYLRDASGARLKAFLAEREIPLVIHHASGHAYIPDLQRLVRALAPARVVPVHSFGSDQFEKFFPRVDKRCDGEWWGV